MTTKKLEEMSKEELLRELRELDVAGGSDGPHETARLLHDLNVHHVELEMQNRELREAQGRLEESRSRYADLYDFAPVGYCTLDPAGTILEVNLTGAALLGAHREALVGAPFGSAAHLQDRRSFLAHMSRCVTETERVTSELAVTPQGRGTRFLQLVSDPVRQSDGRAFAYRTILVDITDAKQLESKLRLLSDAGEQLAASLEFGNTLEVAAGLAVPALADLCMIDVPGNGGTVQRHVVLFADPAKQQLLGERLKDVTLRAGWRSPQARVIDSREVMLLSEVSDELRTRMAYDDIDADVLRATGIRSIMIVPLVARGRVLGTLTFAACESERRYGPSDLRLAQDLASRVGLALENAALYGEAQRSQQDARLAEAKATGIVSVSADAIISIDESQRITLWNDGAEKVFGYPRAEILGAPVDILIPERLRATHRLDVERFAAGAQVARRMGERNGSIVGLRKNGEEFPADATISKFEVGGQTILTVALRDVTEQRRKEAEQTFLADVGLVLANTLDYDETLSRIVELAVRDLADFCILDVVDEDGAVRRRKVVSRDSAKAPICEALLQLPSNRSPTLTTAALQARRPVLMGRVEPEMLAALAQGLGEEHLDILRAIAPRAIIAVPLCVYGKLLGAIALVSTSPSRTYGHAELRLAEELARRAALSVENASLYRVAGRAIQARDEVLGIVAHDLRSPLSSILMQAQLLLRSSQPDLRSLRPAEIIERAAARMNRLIEDLLDVTRVEGRRLAIEPARVSAAQLLSDSFQVQKELAASRSLELRLAPAAKLPDVWADRDRIFQVLENIIGNALKFTPPGGVITLGAVAKCGEVQFSVTDTGVGMAAEDAAHAFDRFWQARRKDRRGAGLGLAISKGIVEAHGGRLWFESEPGVGSTFWFTLAMADRHADRRRVLVIDDEPDAREVLGKALELAGYEVVTVPNGAEALVYLRHAPAPALIFVDLVMPVMDGWGFLAEKNKDPVLRSIPVIVVSGQRDIDDKLAAARASYVPKPLEVDRLLETVERVVQ